MNRLSVELVEDPNSPAATVVARALLSSNGALVSQRTSVNGNPEFIVDIQHDDDNAECFLDTVYGAGNHDGVSAHRTAA